MDDYEIRVRAEIDRRKTEIDALEQALKLYLETRTQRGFQLPRAVPVTTTIFGPSKANGRRKPTPHGGKTKFVMDQIKSSASDGITTEEIYRRMEAERISIKRSSLRSMLWHAKDAKDIKKVGDRYYPAD